MADNTGIEWCDATWNPTRGCSRVSEGCRHCYAERVAARFNGPGQPYEGLARKVGAEARWTNEVRLVESMLDQPLRWKKPRRIFVNSMSDLFHEALPDRAINRVFAVMELARQHTFMVLTKRPERMARWFAGDGRSCREHVYRSAYPMSARWGLPLGASWPLPNVWLGVSIEDQATADARIPLLLETPAAVRFVSAEPLLGPVDLALMTSERLRPEWRVEPGTYNALTGTWWAAVGDVDYEVGSAVNDLPHLDWVIAGGESGPGARPMHPAWPRELRDQCAAAGVPFFFKQWGEWAPAPPVEQDSFEAHRARGARDCHYWRGGAASELLGKARAGDRLDGRQHHAWPTP